MSAKPQASNRPDLDQLLDRLTTYYPRAIDPNLDRTFRLLHDLGNPHERLPPVIHIAGTNGKGSTLAAIRAVCAAAGISCHVMTSPHLVSFHERLVIAGTEITTEPLIDILLEVERINAGQETTSFELTTAAGLLAFSRSKADLCLLETGMGGRLDATNVVAEPLATVITVISLDHTQFLGTTLDAIAGEKAAIMKAGTPCIIGPQTTEGLQAGVMEVFENYAAKIGAPLYRHGYEWSYEITSQGFILHTGTDTYNFPRPNLLGAHQIGNAATAAMTLLTVQQNLPKPLTTTALDEGLTQIKWRARLQKLERGELMDALPEGWELWLDGGHNDTGGQVLAEQATAWESQDSKPLHLVMGMLNTKDPRVFLKYLGPHAASMHAIEIPGQPLSLKADELAAAAHDAIGHEISTSPSALDAVRHIVATSDKPARILITGSLYLAGDILKTNA
jgi:dihydrofolate synthase/folylpolyglutamate synthase